MNKIAIIGHFGENKMCIDGQTIKTQNLFHALSGISEANVTKIDTYGWKKHPFRLFMAVNQAVKENDAIIMLPAHNGVQVFSSLLLFLNKKRKKKLYYDIIGAWLPSLLENKPRVAKSLRQFDGLWAETNTMRKDLEKQGFKNVTIIPNFKDIEPISEQDINYISELPIRLVIFSRISELKGVTDAIEAIARVNQDGANYTLDIYGPIEESYKEKFEGLLVRNSKFTRYGGVINSSDSVSVLKNYHALLFPTKSYTEGIPGTIIDAYCAGLPVIASMWESYSDICIEGKTSLGYDFSNFEDLVTLLLKIKNDPKILNCLRQYSLVEGEKYTSSEVVKLLLSILEV